MSQELGELTEPDSPPSPPMVAVRRRKRRRSEPQVNRRFLYILIVIFFMVVFLVLVPSVRHPLMEILRSGKGKTRIPPEGFALAIAALVLVYLIPGVEEKVLTTLGIKKKSHRSSRRH